LPIVGAYALRVGHDDGDGARRARAGAIKTFLHGRHGVCLCLDEPKFSTNFEQFQAEGGWIMRTKLLAVLMCLALLVSMALPTAARTRHRRHYARRSYYTYSTQHRSFWQKHRDKL